MGYAMRARVCELEMPKNARNKEEDTDSSLDLAT